MMKNFICFLLLSFLFLAPVCQAASQDNSGASGNTLDLTGLPQWVKDMRRWDIITFGTFPFSMFTVTFITDLVRWKKANGMDFSDEGRRYAPWPLKSTGAVDMTKAEYERTILLALGVSAVLAFTDLTIVYIKRSKERQRVESLPAGAVEIEITPYILDEEKEVLGVIDSRSEGRGAAGKNAAINGAEVLVMTIE
jgi:hypothetical protein